MAVDKQHLLVLNCENIIGRIKNGMYCCENCDKIYKSRSGIYSHFKQTHDSYMSHHCLICDAKFAYKSGLEEHLRTHTDERPHQCCICQSRFGRKHDLKRHQQQVHNNNKPFKCEDCGNCFNRNTQLQIHRRKHTGIRPYQCHICTRAFTTSSNLHRHIRNHINKKMLILMKIYVITIMSLLMQVVWWTVKKKIL